VPAARGALLRSESDYSFAARPVGLRRGFALAAPGPAKVPWLALARGRGLVERARKTLARIAACLLGSARIPARAMPGPSRASGSSTEPAGLFRGRSHERALPHTISPPEERNSKTQTSTVYP